jgi:hypothetical protein
VPTHLQHPARGSVRFRIGFEAVAMIVSARFCRQSGWLQTL